MEVFLWYLSDPGFQSGVGYDLGVDRITLCKTFKSDLDCVVDKTSDWIKFPTTLDEINTAQLEWSTRFHIPTAIGALDCTHLYIKKPFEFGNEYVNRKGKCLISFQATCNAHEKFTSIDAQWPGSVQDGRFWHNSAIQAVVQRFDGEACLLGDKNYGLTPWLLTPLPEPINSEQRLYNLTHSQERVFGQLKQPFPILNHRVRIALPKIPQLVVSCAVLHNISKHLNDGWDFEEEESIEEVPVVHLDFSEENPGTR